MDKQPMDSKLCPKEELDEANDIIRETTTVSPSDSIFDNNHATTQQQQQQPQQSDEDQSNFQLVVAPRREEFYSSSPFVTETSNDPFYSTGRLSQEEDTSSPTHHASSVFATSTMANAFYQPPTNYNSATSTTALSSSTTSTFTTSTPITSTNILPSSFIFGSAQSSLQDPLSFSSTSNTMNTSSTSSPTTITTTSTSNAFKIPEAISFSDLAKKNLPTPPESELIFKPNPIQSKSSETINDSTSGEKRESYISHVFPPKTIPPLPDQPAHRIASTADFTLGPYIPPISSSKTTTSLTTTKTAKNNDTEQLLYSPASSPPLDAIPGINTDIQTAVASGSSTSEMTSTGRIPKLNPQQTKSSKDKSDPLNLDSLNMIESQKKYRQVEGQVRMLHKRRNEIEKKINDMARAASGKNIDFDPHFRQLKDDKREIDREIQQARNAMNKISDYLLQKFNYTVKEQFPSQIAHKPPQPPPQQSKRARMSTGGKPAELVVAERNSKEDKIMFDFAEDTKPYCSDCSRLFESATEYCQHLHKREHAINVKKHSTPWRSHKEVIDKKRTFEYMKSICAKVNSDSDHHFTLTDLDKVLTPNLSKEEYKSKSLARERGKFEENDPLFEPKGFNYLLPISGYFCTLCHMTLCDQVEVNLHLRGYDHNIAYMKSVALNPLFESSYRNNLVNAHRLRYGRDVSSSSYKRIANIASGSTVSVSKDRNNSKSLTTSRNIVKPSRYTNDEQEDNLKSRRDRPLRQPTLPEIVPLSKDRAKPSALKRLRTETTDKIDKDILRPNPKKSRRDKDTEGEEDNEVVEIPNYGDDDDDNDDDDMDVASAESNEPEVIVLDAGDPDSPFPDLQLSINGNAHVALLKDKRLAAPLRVKLQRLDLNIYKDMISERENVWGRLNQFMTKKEAPSFCEDKTTKNREVEATFFQRDGEIMPIDLENEDRRGKFSKIKIEKEANENRRANSRMEKKSEFNSSDGSKSRSGKQDSSKTNDKKKIDKGKDPADKESGEDKGTASDKEASKDGSTSPFSGLPDSSEGGKLPTLNFLSDFFTE